MDGLFSILLIASSRAEIYLGTFNNTSVLEDWVKVNDSGNYKVIFDKYSITHALLYTNDNISKQIDNDNNWSLIYKDDNYLLYERIKK